MLFKVLISLLPILCKGEIKINITVASNKYDAVFKYSGHDNKVVTDREVKLFNISMANLNRGFRVELGKVPDGGILLKDPTTYGNLFHKYKWPEVQRHVEVNKIEVIEIVNKEIDLETNEITNNSTGDSQTDKSLFQNVEVNAFSTWSEKGLPEDEIFYNVRIDFEGSHFKYENKWRNSSLKTKQVRFGKSINGKVTIKPGQTLVKKLTATKTIFVVKVDYQARLVGNVIGDYESLYGKYHFWAPTIGNIMRAAKIPNGITTSEKIEIRCYTDPQLQIYDKATRVPVRTKRRLNFKLTPKKRLGSRLGRQKLSTTTTQRTQLTVQNSTLCVQVNSTQNITLIVPVAKKTVSRKV
ncbi:hypothetical protein ABMA27_010154 [Loxostege sticticalis]|uniref:Uncharacterized protein n=1 Tax=Loxostege sticticalis TaxID=481309 RepID=A0ABR3H4S1_LOXSC